MAAWFDIHQMGSGIFMLLEPGHVQSFLVCGRDRAALIDTGLGLADIRDAVSSVTPLPVTVFNTHWHFDHIGGNRLFRDIRISSTEADLLTQLVSSQYLKRIYADPCRAAGVPLPDGFDAGAWEIKSPAANAFPAEGDTVDLGGRLLHVMETPGHTRGSLSFLDSDTAALFCGDLIYNGTLYAHFTDSDLIAYQASLERLHRMKGDIQKIFTCHNDPELPAGFVVRCRDALRSAADGCTRGRRVYDWGTPAIRHDFGRLAVLTKDRASEGVDLLACMA